MPYFFNLQDITLIHLFNMFDKAMRDKWCRHAEESKEESLDRECTTDGRVSLEKQTLQNEELKWLN